MPLFNPAADALNTTVEPVQVADAAPPVAGQVLTATSPTSADWQTPLAEATEQGIALPGAFTGNPKKATITLSAAYPAYAVAAQAVGALRAYAISIESKTTTSFVINLNSNQLAGLEEVDWQIQEV